MDTAIFALGGAKASRLDQALVYKQSLAQSVTCYNQSLKLTGIAGCQITAKPGVKLEDLEAVVWKEIAKLQAEGPTAEEVEAAKAGNLTQTISGLQRLGGFGGVADTLNQFNQAGGGGRGGECGVREGCGYEVPAQGCRRGGVLRARQEGVERCTAQPGGYGCRGEDHESVHTGVRGGAELAQDGAQTGSGSDGAPSHAGHVCRRIWTG